MNVNKSSLIELFYLAILFLSYRFCVGDRYFLYNNQILCEDDHERTKKALLSSSTDSSLYSK